MADKEKTNKKPGKLKTAYNALSIRKIEKVIFGIVIALSLAVGIFLGALVYSVNTQVDIESLETYTPMVPTKIFDVHGDLISELFNEKREIASYDEFPQSLIDAIIANEDTSFFKHPGIDLMGIVRAVVRNVLSFSKQQGASTLTQQVARQVFLSNEKTWTRKLKEMWIALQIERRYTKKEILTLYFNEIFFGHQAYGAKAASQFYFRKDIKDLTLAESALLATLPPNPNRYSPFRDPTLARERHLRGLLRMASVGYISEEEARTAHEDFWRDYEMELRGGSASVYSDAVNKAPYFTEYIRQILQSRYGEDRIKNEGLLVYTTLDLKKQAAATKTMAETLKKENESYARYNKAVSAQFDTQLIDSVDLLTTMFDAPLYIGNRKIEMRFQQRINDDVLFPMHQLTLMLGLDDAHAAFDYALQNDEEELSRKIEGALISINPKNGYIEAMVGGTGFTPRNQLNRATQARRQAGSAFKPFVYAAAIASKKFTASTVVMDSEVAFDTREGELWMPRNYSGTYYGPIRVREALRNSVNVVSVKLLDAVGVEETIEYASPFFNTRSPQQRDRFFKKNLTLALGTGDFSPLELATGFAVIANEGETVYPMAIRYVADRNGVPLDNFEQELHEEIAQSNLPRQAMDPAVAFIITDMLRDVVRSGTAANAVYAEEFRRPAAGKTGTSSAWRDAWFVGYTPQLVTAVWFGFDKPEYSLGRGRAGGVISAPAWAAYMREALKDEPVENFKRAPSGVRSVTVCVKSGLNVTPKCGKTYVEYFLTDASPIDFCTQCDRDESDEILGMESIDKAFESRKRPRTRTHIDIDF